VEIRCEELEERLEEVLQQCLPWRIPAYSESLLIHH